MPKEISHIAMAEQIAARLPGSSLFHGPVTSYPHVFLYGSVAPDVPYFYLIGKKTRYIQALTKKFHTNNKDSLLPILNFLKQSSQNAPDALAFAAGVCCHILCDTLFHPMIYYFAGLDDVHDGATARHRMFETAMDIHFWRMLSDKRLRSLRFLYTRLEIDRQRFFHFFHSLYNLADTPEALSLSRAVRYHQLIQMLFFKPSLFKIGLHTSKIIKIGRFHSLVYPCAQPVILKFFTNPISFKDPCRKAYRTCTVEELTNLTAQSVITLLDIIGNILQKNGDPNLAAAHPDLPEIRPCLVEEKDRFKNWYQKNNIESMLYEKG